MNYSCPVLTLSRKQGVLLIFNSCRINSESGKFSGNETDLKTNFNDLSLFFVLPISDDSNNHPRTTRSKPVSSISERHSVRQHT